MDKIQAKKLIKNTFENSFDKEKYTYLIKNILNNFEDTPETFYKGKYIPDAFKEYISTLDRIGKYEDPNGKKIDILIVKLKKSSSLERARTMQRNFVAWYLKGSRGGVFKDAALVAYISPEPADWRFSFVKMEYTLDRTPSGKLKGKEEFTPAKRYSFLVGENENSHTAQSQLFSFLVDEDKPLLEEIEDSFGIEKVTKEFFKKYRELFLNLKESLEKIVEEDKRLKQEFTKKNVSLTDFAKKTLGQIVFLYFLQKKGWFGVERKDEWGTGPKNFLRLLFEKKIADYNNFFNDILEPLFYNTLAVERPYDYSDRFDCKIPFLNGGLFDPLNEYDWVHTEILIPHEIFSNSFKTKEGDIGTGILDVFDRYNFTVKEDEPLEKEVAVDPEMLGKVFENLLEVKDRKSKGSYYTPREIVHYMCQESLINYLDTEMGQEMPKEDIETLIRFGELTVENDTRVEQNGKETEIYSYKLPELVRENAEDIDKKLSNIKVCDPAVGSGAFLVGIMNEIVRARNSLTPYLSEGDRTVYDFKRQCIHNCLYGVDIDPGAVEIAKLRLWLSLIVEEKEFKTIQP
ncbi:MAG: DNA methyltransferase, partial [Elusimicrobiota bacterium]